MDFAAARPSKSIGTPAISAAVSIGADAPPGMTAFSFRPPRHAARHREELFPRDSDRRLVDAGLLDVAGDAVELRARVPVVSADPLEPVGAAVEDVLDAGERLDVVDDRRAAPGALDGGERAA